MKRLCIHIGLIWIVSCGLISSCVRQTEIKTLREGRELEKRGDYPSALEHYQEMPEPGFREVCEHNLRHLYGDILDAIIAQKNNPNSAETYYALGKAYYEKARSIPEEHEIASNQGFDLKEFFSGQQKQFHTQAHTALESATQLQTGYQEALLLEGKLYEDMGKPEEAITAYQQLVDLQTDSPEAFYRLGILLHDRGEIEEGLEFGEQAIAMAPEDPRAHFTLGILYAREGDDGQATTEFQQVLCLDPNDTEAYYKIAQLYLRQSLLIEAERVLRLGVVTNPESQKLALFYSSLQSTLDDKELDEFVSIYKELVGEVIHTLYLEALKDRDFSPSPALEIRYLHLLIHMIERQRPYILPCAETKENPYFNRRITLLQERIEELEQVIQDQEKAAQSEEEATTAEK